MKISLRQVGGIVGADDQLELNRTQLTIRRRGEGQRTKVLSGPERIRVEDAAQRLLIQPAAKDDPPVQLASDSMTTQVDIARGRERRTFQVQSGQDAPAELWDLVDAMSEAAGPG